MPCKRAASRRRLRRPSATAKTSAGVTGHTILLVAQKPGSVVIEQLPQNAETLSSGQG